MSVPLGNGGPAHAGRPTRQQLLLARERARVTGESVAQALTVFMGAGRYGQQPGAAAAEPPLPAAQAAQSGRAAAVYGPPGPAAPAGRDTAPGEVADVIPLFRSRRRGGDATGD